MRGLALLIVVACTTPASAEVVVFRSGRTLSVASHRVDGNSLVLTFRRGGEVVCDQSAVERIAPDEIPYPITVTPATATGASVPQRARTDRLTRRAAEYDVIVRALAHAQGVDPKLVHAVITVESSYEARARSPKGAMGLMQLMPATARQYKVHDPYDPASNIAAGTRHLRSLMDRFPLALALAAYNAGASAVERFGGVPPFPETQAYVAKVLNLASQ